MTKNVNFAQPIKTTAKKPAAKIGPDGKQQAPARTGVSDTKIALILEKYGMKWPAKA